MSEYNRSCAMEHCSRCHAQHRDELRRADHALAQNLAVMDEVDRLCNAALELLVDHGVYASLNEAEDAVIARRNETREALAVTS